MVVDVAGVLETISSTGDLRDDNATKKIRMDKATKGNNVEYILDGAKVPLKKEMQPHTVYVYKDAEGDIYLTSKKNKTPEKLGKDSNSKAIEKDAQERFNTQGKHSKTPNSNIEEHRKAATEAANNRIDAIKNRLSDINHAEQNPLGTKERDLADLRAITAAAVEKGLIAQTYRQSRAAMIEGVASGAVKIANAVAKGTPEPVKRSIRETAALVSVPVNMAIGVVFGGEKAPGFDKATTIGSAADKVANRAQATWEAMKTSEFTALRQPVKALDIAANAVHTAVNSKALGRTVGVVIAAATVWVVKAQLFTPAAVVGDVKT